MRIAVDAHAIGRRLTGNEVLHTQPVAGFCRATGWVRVLRLRFIGRGRRGDTSQYTRSTCGGQPLCAPWLGLGRKVRQDRADLLHVQYTAPLACSRASSSERTRCQLSRASRIFHSHHGPPSFGLTVGRTVRSAAKILTVQRIFAPLDPEGVRRYGRGQSGGRAQRRRIVVPSDFARGGHRRMCATA